MTATTADEEAIQLSHPSSLRRLAPEAIVVQSIKRGDRPHVSLGGIHLRARKKYWVRVLPQRDEFEDATHHVGLVVDEHLRSPGHTQESLREDGRKEHVLTLGCAALFRPFPVRTSFSVVLRHTRWGDYNQSIPVVVWPSLWNQLAWAFTCLFVPLWMPRLADVCFYDGHLRPSAVMLDKLRDSQEFLVITAAVTLAGAYLVRLLGWAAHAFIYGD